MKVSTLKKQELILESLNNPNLARKSLEAFLRNNFIVLSEDDPQELLDNKHKSVVVTSSSVTFDCYDGNFFITTGKLIKWLGLGLSSNKKLSLKNYIYSLLSEYCSELSYAFGMQKVVENPQTSLRIKAALQANMTKYVKMTGTLYLLSPEVVYFFFLTSKSEAASRFRTSLGVKRSRPEKLLVSFLEVMTDSVMPITLV